MFETIKADLRKEIEDLKWANRGTDLDVTKLKIAKEKLEQTLLCEKIAKEKELEAYQKGLDFRHEQLKKEKQKHKDFVEKLNKHFEKWTELHYSQWEELKAELESEVGK